MPVQIKWLSTARQNLDDEATYIAQEDAAAASRVVARVLEAVAQLSQQPGLGRPGRVPGTRELVVSRTRYLVPYIVNGDQVTILRVFHTSRRLPKEGLHKSSPQPPRALSSDEPNKPRHHRI